jgi:hypothetical protein
MSSSGIVAARYGNPGLDVVQPTLTSVSLRLRGYEGDSGSGSDSDSDREPKSCGEYCFMLYGDDTFMVSISIQCHPWSYESAG